MRLPALQGQRTAKTTEVSKPAILSPDSVNSQSPPAETVQEEEAEQVSLMELFRRFRDASTRDALAAKRFVVVGQYYADRDCGENEFKLIRVIITCCLADAQVFGLRVRSAKPFTARDAGEDTDRSEAQAMLQESNMAGAPVGGVPSLLREMGGWVRAEGKVQIECDRDGYESLVMIATKVSRAEPPERRYMFFGQEEGMGW